MLIIWLKGLQPFRSALICKRHPYLQKNLNSSIVQEGLNREDITKEQYSNDNKLVKPLISESSSLIADTISQDRVGLNDKIIKWAIQNNVSSIAFSQLLKILHEYGLKNLPKNSQVLLKAKELEIKVSSVPPGIYTHFGFEKNLRHLITNLINKNVFNQSNINVSIFIDNLPLSHITQKSLWVILGSVVGFSNIIFFVGAYHGYSKPKNPNLFLSEFVKEAKHLCMHGLEINKIIYKVNIKRLICDAPAKAYVLNVKNCGGYSSCTKCNAVGQYKNKSISFEEKCDPRTDADFQKNDIYINTKTELLEIPEFGVVSNVPLDYMHLVCLGVVKKLLTIWLSSEEFWINKSCAADIIKTFAPLCPCEFQTKPKSLNLFTRWSANEFRRFLLYHGPIVLKRNLKKTYYDHFLLLHIACRLLCTEVNSVNIDCGRELLNTFVKNYKNLYKQEQITHNIHGLYHLADDCCAHGTLDSFSSFSFEKFLLKLRNSMKKSKRRLIPQTILKESYDKVFAKALQKVAVDDFKAFRKLQISGSDQFANFSQYEKLLLKNAEIIPHAMGDNCVCLKNKKIIEVTNILEEKKKNKSFIIAGREFTSVSNFYSGSFAAFDLSLFKVEKLSNVVATWPAEMIEKKCMKIPVGSDELVVIGLLEEHF